MADYSGDNSDYKERQELRKQIDARELLNTLSSVRTRMNQGALLAEADTGLRLIAAGGCEVTLPDDTIPPFPPPPWQTGTPDPEPEKDKNVDVMIIWAVNPGSENEPWVVTAWDTETISENPDGWMEALAEAEEQMGGRYIRVTRTAINYDRVIAAFQPVDV